MLTNVKLTFRKRENIMGRIMNCVASFHNHIYESYASYTRMYMHIVGTLRADILMQNNNAVFQDFLT